jgi:hypothetical protein
MASGRFLQLIRNLIRRTEDGFISWKDMPNANAFQALLQSGSVIVRREVGYDQDEHPYEFAVVTLLDHHGQVVDEYSDSATDGPSWDLFLKARSRARDSEGVIAKLLEEIG